METTFSEMREIPLVHEKVPRSTNSLAGALPEVCAEPPLPSKQASTESSFSFCRLVRRAPSGIMDEITFCGRPGRHFLMLSMMLFFLSSEHFTSPSLPLL